MSNKISRYIPDKITYFLKPSVTQVSPGGREWTVSPAFPVRTSAPEDVKDTARAWVCGQMKGWAGRNGRPERWDQVQSVEDINNPISDVSIIDLDVRDQGGSAWKVVLPGQLLVDLRTDVFLPILLTHGLSRSGIIPNAKFQWGMNGSQLKLLHVGSDEWKTYVTEAEYTQSRTVVKKKKTAVKYLSPKELVVGRSYEFCDGHKVFFGECDLDGKTGYVWVNTRYICPVDREYFTTYGINTAHVSTTVRTTGPSIDHLQPVPVTDITTNIEKYRSSIRNLRRATYELIAERHLDNHSWYTYDKDGSFKSIGPCPLTWKD